MILGSRFSLPMNELPGFFVALFFEGSDAHITLCLRKHCSVDDLQQMVNQLRSTIRKLLPLAVAISPGLTMKGEKGDVPTHDVYFADYRARIILSKLYSEMIDSDSPFQTWSPHVTVDTDEKKQLIDGILEKSSGMAIMTTATLKQLGFKDTLFSTMN